ncbi:MAG: hypothetical protein AAF439_12950, partial [Pseudomonadota bacterium]
MRHTALSALAGLGLLAGCAAEEQDAFSGFLGGEAWDVDAVAALPAPDDPYLAALKDGYTALAATEVAESDWNDGAVFRRKALLAAQGSKPAPEDPAELPPTAAAAPGLLEAYIELSLFVASEGALLRAGRQIGEAQVQFDCWAREAGEGAEAADAVVCRDTYQALVILIRDLAALPDNLAVVLPEEEGKDIGGIELQQDGKTIQLDSEFAAAGVGKAFGDLPVTASEIKEAFAGALAAQPEPPKEFSLTFEFNSTRITDTGFEAVLLAAGEARRRPAAEVIVTGYADRVGDAADSLSISRQRA